MNLNTSQLRQVAKYVGLGKTEIGTSISKASKTQLMEGIQKTGWWSGIENAATARVGAQSLISAPTKMAMPLTKPAAHGFNAEAFLAKQSIRERAAVPNSGGFKKFSREATKRAMETKKANFVGPKVPIGGAWGSHRGYGEVVGKVFKDTKNYISGGSKSLFSSAFRGNLIANMALGASGAAVGGTAGFAGEFLSDSQIASRDGSMVKNMFKGAMFGAGLSMTHAVGQSMAKGGFGGKYSHLTRAGNFTVKASESGVVKGALFAGGVYNSANLTLTKPMNPIK